MIESLAERSNPLTAAACQAASETVDEHGSATNLPRSQRPGGKLADSTSTRLDPPGSSTLPYGPASVPAPRCGSCPATAPAPPTTTSAPLPDSPSKPTQHAAHKAAPITNWRTH